MLCARALGIWLAIGGGAVMSIVTVASVLLLVDCFACRQALHAMSCLVWCKIIVNVRSEYMTQACNLMSLLQGASIGLNGHHHRGQKLASYGIAWQQMVSTGTHNCQSPSS